MPVLLGALKSFPQEEKRDSLSETGYYTDEKSLPPFSLLPLGFLVFFFSLMFYFLVLSQAAGEAEAPLGDKVAAGKGFTRQF